MPVGPNAADVAPEVSVNAHVDDLEVLAGIETMQFDDEDNLVPVAAAGAAVHA